MSGKSTEPVIVPESAVRPEPVKASGQRDPVAIFTLDRIRGNVLLIIGLLLLNKLGAPGNVLFYGILLLWSFRGPEGALKALSLSGLLIVASEFFVSRGAPVGPLKYLLLLTAGLVILSAARNLLAKTYQLLLLLFGLVAAVLAVINDYFVTVSLLKVASFTFGAFCLLGVVNINRNMRQELVVWAFSLILAVCILSYGALVIGTGYGSYETIWGGRFSGFRGAMSHPQTMGVMACIFAVYLTSLLLFVKTGYRRLIGGTLVAILGLLYLSEARTGMFGYFLSLGLIILFSSLSRVSVAQRNMLARYRKQLSAAVVAILAILLLIDGFSGIVSSRAAEFIKKGEFDSSEEVSLVLLYKARESQINSSWENFKQNPLTGIGFGTDLSPFWQRKATFLSASTEKGFMPTALLEEVGIVGTFFFLLFIISLYIFLIKSGRLLGLAMITALLVVNLGEMMFFAFGGMATLCWTLIGISISPGDDFRKKDTGASV